MNENISCTGFANVIGTRDPEEIVKNAESLSKEISKHSRPSVLSHIFRSQASRDKIIKDTKEQWNREFGTEYPMVPNDKGDLVTFDVMGKEVNNAIRDEYTIPSDLEIEASKTPAGKLMVNEVETGIRSKHIHIPYAIGKQLEAIWKENEAAGLETRIHRTPCKDSRLANIMEKGLDILPDNISSVAQNENTVPDIDFTTAPINNYGQYLRYLTSLSGIEYHGADGVIVLGIDKNNPQFSFINPDNRISGSIDPSQIKGYVHGINGNLDHFFTRNSILEQQHIMDQKPITELNKNLEQHLLEVQQRLGQTFMTDTGKIAEELGISQQKAKELCDSRPDLLEPSYSDHSGQFYYKHIGTQHSLMSDKSVFKEQKIEEKKGIETSSMRGMIKDAKNEIDREPMAETSINRDELQIG